MVYKKNEIESKVSEALLKNASQLYTEPFLNYIGEADGMPYTEIAAKMIAAGITDFIDIKKNLFPVITRTSSYKTKSHAALAKQNKPDNTNRNEEWIAKGLYGKTLKNIGKIIDFQTPLKDTSDDKVGKIDLLSYNEEENAVYILELKKPGSTETLLRCVLETYTYWRIVNMEKLLHDFDKSGCELRKAVLLFKDSLAYKQLNDKGCCPETRRLMELLNVSSFVLSE
jgi:hypothetical protein